MATEPFAEAREVGHEGRDASTRGLFIFFVSMAGALLLIGFLLVWLFGFFARTSKPAPVINQPFSNLRPLPAAPLLQPQPSLDHEEYMKSQQQFLQSYRWIDRQNGVVRIPIEQAMKLLLKQGLPSRSSQGTTALKQSRGTNTASPGSSRQEARR